MKCNEDGAMRIGEKWNEDGAKWLKNRAKFYMEGTTCRSRDGENEIEEGTK